MNVLSRLTNIELENKLKDLVSQERKLLHLILLHIKEVDCRRLYLERAYSSLYEYLTKELQYSGSAAMRRIEAARLLKDVPVIAEKIEAGILNLSQIGELARAVKEKEKTGAKVSALQKSELVAAISGKTTQETQKELSVGLDLEIMIPERARVQKDDSVRLEISLSSSQYKKFLACKDLAAHTVLKNFGDASWVSLFENFVDQFLIEKTGSVELFTTASETGCVVIAKANKSVTPKTRRLIFKRDHCCQYKDSRTGRICGSTFGLEVDHKRPQWADGGHAADNLQMLCRAHNDYKYQMERGVRFG